MKSILFLIACMATACANGAVYYVGGGAGQVFGTNCDAVNGPSSPHAYMNSRRHCYQPGDTLYWTSGTFAHSSPHFRSGFIDLRAAPLQPITIAPRPGEYDAVTNPCPVTFSGQFWLEQEDWGTEQRFGSRDVHFAPGICFTNTTTTGDTLTIEASGIHVEGSTIRTDPGTYLTSTASGKDCVKISNPTNVDGAYPTTDTYLNRNIYVDCSEDAIDITGTSNVTVHRADIDNSAIFQIKLGATGTAVTHSTIDASGTGPGARGGECPTIGDGGIGDYCGNPAWPTRPINERYSAQYVAINNNTFTTIGLGNALNLSGMGDAVASHNTIVDGNTTSGSVVVLGTPTLAYTDTIAQAHCAANPSECSACTMTNPNCNLIPHKAERVRLIDNAINGDGSLLLITTSFGVNGITDICRSNNTWNSSPSAASFGVLGTGYSDISLTGIPEC